jgi:hypothetical protein
MYPTHCAALASRRRSISSNSNSNSNSNINNNINNVINNVKHKTTKINKLKHNTYLN